MKIITNNVPREVHDDWNQEGEFNDSFVVYKGEKYLLEDFMGTIDTDFREDWDGVISDTFFSGILLKWVQGSNYEQVVMGRYYT